MKRCVAFVIPAALGIGWSSTSRPDVINGTFDSDLSVGWAAEGHAVIVTGPSGNRYLVMEEPGRGGRTRIYQEFELPPVPTFLSFRYRMFGGPQARNTAVPPDSFTAFLLDAAGQRLPATLVDPAFTKAFFYTDTDPDSENPANPKSIYDSPPVTVTALPDAEGFYTVVMDIHTLAPQTVRIEFALAAAGNVRAPSGRRVLADGVKRGRPFLGSRPPG